MTHIFRVTQRLICKMWCNFAAWLISICSKVNIIASRAKLSNNNYNHGSGFPATLTPKNEKHESFLYYDIHGDQS